MKILNKEIQVSCPAEAEEQLLEATLYLDKKMREISKNGRIIGVEKLAIIAALNITHELLSNRQQKEVYVQSVSAEIERLQNKLEDALIISSADEPELSESAAELV